MSRKKKAFDEKYIPEPNSGCWLWTSGWTSQGYGQASYNVKAHRLSYELHKGPIPPGLNVCHKCDTPACVNPAHLFLGTLGDNVADMMKKGRNCSGEAHHSAKMTERDVLVVLASSESSAQLAADFGVHQETIIQIRNGRIWRKVKRANVAAPPKPRYRLGVNCAASKLSESDVRLIRARLAAGEYPRSIAAAFGVGKQAIYDIKSGHTWSSAA